MESYFAMAFECFRQTPKAMVRIEFQLPGFVHRVIRYYSDSEASDAIARITNQGGRILKRTRYEERDSA